MESEYSKARFSIVIGVLLTTLFLMLLLVPGFGHALWQTLYCSFANVTCVQIVP